MAVKTKRAFDRRRADDQSEVIVTQRPNRPSLAPASGLYEEPPSTTARYSTGFSSMANTSTKLRVTTDAQAANDETAVRRFEITG